MTGALDLIVKREDIDVPPQRVLFQDLISGAERNLDHTFQRTQRSGGQESKKEKPPEEPVISLEEEHKRRLEAIEQETYQKTFAAAEKAGLALGEEKKAMEIAQILPQFESVLRQLDGLPQRIFAGVEQFLVETSITLTRELLAHELTVNPQGIVDRVKRILEQSIGRHDIVIHVSPGNAELLRRLGEFDHMSIAADPAVAPGSVRVESDFGGMEDNLEQQLAEMESGIRLYLQDRLDGAGYDDLAAASKRHAQEERADIQLSTDPNPDQFIAPQSNDPVTSPSADQPAEPATMVEEQSEPPHTESAPPPTSGPVDPTSGPIDPTSNINAEPQAEVEVSEVEMAAPDSEPPLELAEMPDNAIASPDVEQEIPDTEHEAAHITTDTTTEDQAG